jgi:2-dehydro-3-deoxygluconokinase
VNEPTATLVDLRSAESCRWDLVSLGEVMLRLDPGEGRIATARSLRVWEGGGEYNVARGLRRCFGLRTAIVTALADNPVGRLVEDLMLQGGVDQSHVRWVPFDGVGRSARNGLNFTERGFGARGAVGCSDRGHTAVSQLRPGDIDWDDIFAREGARWFHCGGIFAALSETTAAVAAEAMAAAHRAGTIVSYDLNYRSSLWRSIGGQERAREVNRGLAPLVDVMLGNEEDFGAALGFEVEGVDADLKSLDPERFGRMMKRVVVTYANIRVLATTLRAVQSATRNDWSAVCWAGDRLHQATSRPGLEILDRVGGGDSFASGLIFGLLSGFDIGLALEYGAAHGALAMTTPGDTSMATLTEVEALVRGAGARVQR